MEKIFHANEKEKKAGVAALIPNKIGFKTNDIVRDKEGYYIMIKRTIQQGDITLVNIYTPNIGAPKYVKQILMDIERATKMQSQPWIFNTLLTSMDRSSRKSTRRQQP